MTNNHLLLYRLAELMLEHEQHQLPVDMLFDDSQIGDFVKSIQIDSPYQQMLIEGVLTESVRDEKLYVGFTVEGYFHYVLGDVIFKQTEYQPAEALRKLIEENKLIGANEGVEQCLIRDVQKDDLKRLIWLIDYGGKCLHKLVVPLAYSFASYQDYLKKCDKVEELITDRIIFVFNSLMSAPTDNDIDILNKAIELLEKRQKNSIVHFLRLTIIDRVAPTNIKKAILYATSLLQAGQKEIERRIQNIEKASFPKNTNEYLQFMDLKGQLYEEILFYKEALACFRISLKEKLNKLGKRHLEVAYSYNYLGRVFYKQQNYDDSIKMFTKAHFIFSDLNGMNHHTVAGISHNLSCAWDEKNNIAKAIKYCNLALQTRLQLFGYYHPETAAAYNLQGGLFSQNQKYDSAISARSKALEIYLKLFGEIHESTAGLLNNLGNIYRNINNYSKAIELTNQSLAINLKLFKKDHPRVLENYINIGAIWFDKGNHKRAIKYFKKAEKLYKTNQSIPFILFENMGLAYEYTLNYEMAEIYYRKSLLAYIEMHGKSSEYVADHYFNLGRVLHHLNKFEDAIIMYNNGLDINENSEYTFYIALCYERIFDLDTSLNYYIKCASILFQDKEVDREKYQTTVQKAIELANKINKYNVLPDWMK